MQTFAKWKEPKGQARTAKSARPLRAEAVHDGQVQAILKLQRKFSQEGVRWVAPPRSEGVGGISAAALIPQEGRSPLAVASAHDPLEREADVFAQEFERMWGPTRIHPAHSPIRRDCDDCENTGRSAPPLATPTPSTESQSSPHARAVTKALKGGGTPLPEEVRSPFELGLGRDLSHVRVHADGDAAEAARALNARAFTLVHRVVFGAGEYAPNTSRGRRLLAHELSHVVQQDRGQGHRPIMRNGAPAPQAQPRPATVEESAEFLEEMAGFIQTARSFALDLVRATPGVPVTDDARWRAHRVLNQKRLQEMLTNARKVYAIHEAAIQSGDPHGTRLRAALLGVIVKIREAIPDALAISDALPAPIPADERRLNATLVADLIEADPMTSTGMFGTPAFGAAETALGTSHEAFIEAYLDDLIRTLPGQNLPAANRDAILQRISEGLRRAFLTVAAGPAGTIDVRAITNPTIVEKYRRVNELLSAAMSSRPAQLNIITDRLPAYVLPPDPVPDVTAQLNASTSIGTVDLSRVPGPELPYVRYGVLQVANVVFPATSTVRFRNASWPLTFQVRRSGNLVNVRYDLIFDASSNVRVERLGDAGTREVAPAFSGLSVADKKRQLVADFGLSGVDDRPAATGRPLAAWTSAELDQVKAAFDLIPAGDRAALQGVALVRDHQGPAASLPGQILMGFAHVGPSAAQDTPGPPAHGPPHIHYYDAAFEQNAVAAVGPPGATGPGGDWTLTHEVGHMRIFLATTQANAAIAAANQQIIAANAGIAAVNAPLPAAQHQVRVAYGQARTAANTAIQALNAAVVATPPATSAQRAVLLQAAQVAVAARDQARADLAAAGVPQAMVQAANNLDAAQDALLAATVSVGVAQDQIPTFISLAGTFGFTAFTDYARQGGDDEFFAETYALYLTDPNRLSAMNRSIFLWFQAGMPMDPGWRPPP